MSFTGSANRKISLGFIGLGNRCMEQVKTLFPMEDVEIVHICDLLPQRVERMQKMIQEEKGFSPKGTSCYQQLLQDEQVEAVLIMTSWQSHIRLAVDAMKQGKIVGLEVGGAASIEECWKLVRTSEETGIPCMLLENCCYGKEEMTLLHMVKQHVFGELIHCQGGYQHDLREEIGLGDLTHHYRQENFLHRNGELYPTHELGPIAKYLCLNRGNRMVSLVSMASKALGQKQWLEQNRPNDPIAKQAFQQGDIVTTMIQCAKGETILLIHDCTLPRAYSRGGRVQGTKGLWMEDNRSIFIEGVSPEDPDYWTHRWESDGKYMEQYCHPLWKSYEDFGPRGGHGGMDFLVLRAFIESIQTQQPFPIDVYDTAAWMCITALSEQSIAMGSMPVPIPDFTDGLWIEKRPFHQGAYGLDG
ncbi:MAG: Gfo/Idh/MocA family oxidoreductase [Clostridiales bacterium]|nr:Gfo/Idh/MocA family oxidoreductase [Clostridiales bacterium]